MGRFLDRLPPWFTIALSFVGTIAILALADGTLQSPHANHPPAAGHCRVATAKRSPSEHRQKRSAANPPLPTALVPGLLLPTAGGRAELPPAARQASREEAARLCPASPETAPVLLDADQTDRQSNAGRLPVESAADRPDNLAVGPSEDSVPHGDCVAPEPLPLVIVPDGRQLPLLPLPPLGLPPVCQPEPSLLEASPTNHLVEGAECSARGDRAEAAPRSWDLELIARQADRHTRRGCELAARKAVFSARLEFIRALRLIAQGLDAQNQTTEHGEALAAGLRAMNEAGDFLPKASRLEADLDVAMIAGAHTTPILHGADARSVSPLEALRRYFDYAQARLAAGAGNEIAGSVALQFLGKLHVVMADQPVEPVVAAEPKAMAFFQAALIVAPRNYIASNELGVLLARAGRHQEAKAAFEHSVAAKPTAEAWRNLALTCEQLGIMDAAYHAATEAIALDSQRQRRRDRLADSRVRVEWVEPERFAGQAAASAGDENGAPATIQAAGPNDANMR